MNDIATDPALSGQAESAQAGAEAQPQITNLDSLSEFEYQGQRLTPDRLQEIMNGYQAYSKGQKTSANEERYWSNLDADIENVLADPSMADKFKSIYPEKFHRILDRLLNGQSPKQGTTNAQAPLPKEVLNRLSKVDTLESMLHQQAVDAANAKLDALLPKLYEKFPLANEDQVLARAEQFINQGGKLTDQVWQRLAKESHEGVSKKADAFYKKQLQTQLDKGQMGRDAGPGGMAPGKAPVKAKTFAEAQDAMIQHLKAQGWS